MAKRHLISRKSVPFARGKNTYGLKIIREDWRTGTGIKTYWKYSLPDGVQIFGLTADGQIIAISEFQPSVGTNYVHLPGETMEKGETPLEAAVRGLLEETGYKAGDTEYLCAILENSGRSDRLIHFVLAVDCRKTRHTKEMGIKTVLMNPREFWNRLVLYFHTNQREKHGGGNTLKAAVLAYLRLGWLTTIFPKHKEKVR